MPVKRSCRARSMTSFCWRSDASTKDVTTSPTGIGEVGATSVVELDVLVELDRTLLVLHDVVAVQTVAVLVEIVFALGARELLDREDGFADLGRLGRAGLVDGRRQDVDGVEGPGALVVGRDLDGIAVDLAERLRALAGILGIVGNAIGIVERGT